MVKSGTFHYSECNATDAGKMIQCVTYFVALNVVQRFMPNLWDIVV